MKRPKARESERDPRVGALRRIDEEREAAAVPLEAVEGVVVDSEDVPEGGGEQNLIVRVGERLEQRKQRSELLRVAERASSRDLVRDPSRLERARVDVEVSAAPEEH